MDCINVYHRPHAQTKIAAFLAKKSDYARILNPKSYHDWLADTPEGMKLHRYVQTTVQGIWMKHDTGGPLSDVRVRRAINLIIDRDAMEDSVFKTVSLNGFGCGYVFRRSPWASPYEDLRQCPTCVPTADKGLYLHRSDNSGRTYSALTRRGHATSAASLGLAEPARRGWRPCPHPDDSQAIAA